MSLTAGARLGAYEIVAPLGAGGMGEVYRARDTKLNREVAIKVLPNTVAHDPERLARFEREAKTLAALNHPNIAHIHGFEDSTGVPALVMELVEGPTLADRIAKGPIPIEEALPIAKQIAEALEAAHEQGIIHRDLKPANIKVREDGTVKVLDFGLAKALDTTIASNPNVTQSPTITTPAMTGVGMILGTAAYMSPEQAKGKPADKRSDIWAFGAILYELLAGVRAFQGEDVSDTLATVLKGRPDWAALPSATPPAVGSLVRRCLERDRGLRIGDVAVIRYVLGEPDAAPVAAPIPQRSSHASVAIVAGLLAAAVVGAAAVWTLKPSDAAAARAIARFSLTLPPSLALTSTGRHVVAISPDGLRIVYTANSQLFLRSLDQLEAAPIRGTADGATEPFFSPDSQSVAYWSTGHLKRISINGGAATTLCQVGALYGASWTGDRILFGEGSQGIFEVPATGGAPKVIVAADAKKGEFLHGPQLLPGGDAVLFTSGSARSIVERWSGAEIAVQSLTTGVRKTLVSGGTDARYLSTGHLVYVRDNVLFANAFDVRRLALVGGPTAVLENVPMSGNNATGAAQVAISGTGTLLYPPSSTSQNTSLVWRNRQGVETPIAAPTHAYETPRISPDGTRIAVHALDQDSDLWVWDTRSETLTRLTFDKGADITPAWTPDGKRIVYVSAHDGAPNLFWKPADGTGQPEALLAQPPTSNGALTANAVSRDGKTVIFSIGVPADVMALPLEGDRTPRPVVAQPSFAERGADLSPNGRWIAYNSDESGTFQVYVRPFPNADAGKWQVSGDGGTLPRWAPDGRELFYVDRTGHLMSASVEAGATFAFGRAHPLFDLGRTGASTYRNYDVAPDGSRFVVVKVEASSGAPEFVVVENWLEELKARVPTK